MLQAIISILLAVSSAQAQEMSAYKDSELQAYTDEFMEFTNAPRFYYDPMEVVFRDLGAERALKDPKTEHYTIGQCHQAKGPGFVVIIPSLLEVDPHFWANALPDHKWALVMHEMGHCICNLDHVDDIDHSKWRAEGVMRPDSRYYFSDGCNRSVMTAIIQPDYCVYRHKEEYKRRLKSECKREIDKQLSNGKTEL